MGKINIALLSGGASGEREISIRSGDTVYRALDKEKYNVCRYDPRDDLEKLITEREKIDLAFILLHGRFGEDGCIQGFLELLGIPYVGSGVLSSAMAFNKKVAKETFKSAGLNVIKDIQIRKNQEFSADEIIKALGPSMVVKPVSEGSSLGMSICHSLEELLRGIDQAFQYDQEVMVEQHIQGREITCCVLGNRDVEALPLVEIIPNQEYDFFDYRAKYSPGATREICPAPISEKLTREAQSCGKKAHITLKCDVWSRSDMIIHGDKIYLLEINTVPGMTEMSLVPLATKSAGITMPQLLDRLIKLSLETNRFGVTVPR